ncbi:unnamed protein product [Linum tenue]|uniref:F-box domain-containing protein n=2 Tax=Linum tenue TaxID=586396 RepID=A0AAV0QP64_9ROSI|nr:unnamed protein product [Linum tenue]
MIRKLGDDLLVEILIRLPNPRSACSCKLVCRRWSSLISHHSFNRSFISHQQGSMKEPRPLLIHSNDASDLTSFMPPMPITAQLGFRVLDCFKDLFLCGYGDFDNDNHELGRTYVVCNQFTKQWMALPVAPAKEEGYEAPVSRLVCEPCISSNLDLGDGEPAYVYSEYRFRVVCIYQHKTSIKLDVFCSESGKWTNKARAFHGCRKLPDHNVISLNGELLWFYADAYFGTTLVALNIFPLDLTPTYIGEFYDKPRGDISVSQGALHIIALEGATIPTRVSIWRLEEGRESWKKQCEGLVETPGCNYEPEHLRVLDLASGEARNCLL